MAPEPQPIPVPAGIRRGTRYFPELEALRGFAIALVFAFHADGKLLMPFLNRVGSWPSPPLAYVWAGHTGVTLFFILSAFLLSLPFLEEAYGGRHVSRRRFYARRALRILPIYYAAVATAAILTARTATDLCRGVPYLAFLEARAGLTTPMHPFSAVWWSLATEMQFYALLPLVALAFGRPRRDTLLLLALYAVWYTAIAREWLHPGMERGFRAQSVVGRGPLFVFGILAAWLWLRHGPGLRARLARSRWLAAGGADLLLLLVLLVLGYLLRWATFHGFIGLEISRRYVWHVPEGMLWTAVLLIVLLFPLRTKALLSNRVMARLGVLSYSIYVLHQPLFHYTLQAWRLLFPHTEVGWNALTASWFALTTLTCVMSAGLTYRLIERPFLVRKARLDVGAPAAHARAA